MKRFLILILFSLLFPIQNSSAAPSLGETIDFLINGDDDSGWIDFRSKLDWSIDDKCILKKRGRDSYGKVFTLVIDLNKVIVETFKSSFKGNGFTSKCKGCVKFEPDDITRDWWEEWNGVTWKRNQKALINIPQQQTLKRTLPSSVLDVVCGGECYRKVKNFKMKKDDQK